MPQKASEGCDRKALPITTGRSFEALQPPILISMSLECVDVTSCWFYNIFLADKGQQGEQSTERRGEGPLGSEEGCSRLKATEWGSAHP